MKNIYFYFTFLALFLMQLTGYGQNSCIPLSSIPTGSYPKGIDATKIKGNQLILAETQPGSLGTCWGYLAACPCENDPLSIQPATFQWYRSLDEGISWRPINNETSQYYEHPVPGMIVEMMPSKILYRRSASCALSSDEFGETLSGSSRVYGWSNIVSITFVNPLIGGRIKSNHTLIQSNHTAVQINNGEAAYEGYGAITYQWQSCTHGNNWTAIPGATNEWFNPGTLSETTTYRRVAYCTVPGTTDDDVPISTLPGIEPDPGQPISGKMDMGGIEVEIKPKPIPSYSFNVIQPKVLVAYSNELTIAIDTDGDGVPDDLDLCPDTPTGVVVDEQGCPLDTDGDDVPDYLDLCPDTPTGMPVDEYGCPLINNILSNDQNYITAHAPQQACTNLSDINVLSRGTQVAYYDGLGRPMQQVVLYGSPNGNDLITPITYDELGRHNKDILPYMAAGSNGTYRSDAVISQASFYNGLYPGEGSHAANRNSYEVSPLSRIERSFLPGGEGYETTSRSIGHSYQANRAGEVIRWLMDNNGMLSTDNYAVGALYVEEVTDPDGRIIRTYTDKKGQVVEMRQLNPDRTVAQVTSYVFDERGLLRCVIPPKAKNYSANSAEFNNLIYRYDYDYRGRCIIKKLPDADPIYFVYDKLDRLVMRQHGNMRIAGKWMVTLYDSFDREVATGLLACSMSHASLTSYYENTIVNQVRSGANYTLSSVVNIPAISINDVLSYTFYDSYAGLAAFDTGKFANTAPQKIDASKGQMVGTRVKVLDGNEHTSSAKWLANVTYYDNMYRPIQTIRDLYDGATGGKAFISINFFFDGKPEKAREVQVFNGITTTVTQRYEYDQVRRPKKIYHQIDGQAEKLLAQTTYDALGRAQTKKMDNIETINYAYNIRNWLTKIESPNFRSDIFYHSSNPEASMPAGVAPRWNGNIAAVSLKNDKSYKYTYDGFDRLISGIHTDGYNETVSGYDPNGNIESLTRTGGVNAASYGYTYSGNRLSSLQSGSSTYTYAYDNNGNTITDGRRGMTIAYNMLNLPKRISKNGQNLDYIYDAAGNKLAKKLESSYSQFYAGSIVYTGSKTLEYVIHDEGLAIKVTGGYAYQYNLPDHLGNIRAVINNGATVQQTDYYPFGTAHILGSTDKNKYLYGGKELQTEMVGGTQFAQYDFGVRFYDPLIGRWGTVDPLAEKFYNASSFAYCNNNPILNFDPNGMYWLTKKDQEYAVGLSLSMGFTIQAKEAEIQRNENSIRKKSAKRKNTLNEEVATRNLQDEIVSLQQAQEELEQMGETPEQAFTFVQIGENAEKGGTIRRKDNTIEMTVSSKAIAIHEAAHGYDIWKGGPTTAENMRGRERKAYSRQLAFNKSSMPSSALGGKPETLTDITDNWVIGIKDSNNDYTYIRYLHEGQGQTYKHSIGASWIKALKEAAK